MNTDRTSARVLIIEGPTVTSEATNADVLEVFSRCRDLVSLPVLEADVPIGLISRNIFMSQMSRPYYRELYERKSCIAFMDKAPLVVESSVPVEVLAARAVQAGDKTLADGFIIVEDGKFAGVGTGLELMRVLAELQGERNRQVMQSIDYASTIQRSMLSDSLAAIGQKSGEAGLVWEPRDVVGGDFFHFQEYEDGWFAAVADCTGHGVPGAFLTLIASSLLSHGLDLHGPRDPGRLMGEVSRGMKQALGQHAPRPGDDSDDGMDAAFLWFENTSCSLTSAHAKMPLLMLAPGASTPDRIEGERMGLGYADTPPDQAWRNRLTHLERGALLCCSTDGLVDQVGGPRRIGYGRRRLAAALVQHRGQAVQEILGAVLADVENYQGKEGRRDDLTLFCIRVA